MPIFLRLFLPIIIIHICPALVFIWLSLQLIRRLGHLPQPVRLLIPLQPASNFLVPLAVFDRILRLIEGVQLLIRRSPWSILRISLGFYILLIVLIGLGKGLIG